MVKLTPELIETCAQYTNPVRDRELDLRGYKIPVIENMGATLDQFDTIDLSDNEIRKVDGFPLLRRLKCLLVNNNRVVRIGEHLEEVLPNLDSLVLTNNNISDLGDLDNIATIKTLSTLSLMRNPVTSKKHYRLYVAYKLPQIRLLDFRKIKMKEREAALKLFKGKKGQAYLRDVVKRPKTFVPGGGAGAPPEKKAALAGAAAGGAGPPESRSPGSTPTPGATNGITENGQNRQDVEAIKMAIANAKTLEEVERLNAILQSGQIPGAGPAPVFPPKGFSFRRRRGAPPTEEMDTM